MDKIVAPKIDVGDLSQFIEKSFLELKNDLEVVRIINNLNISDDFLKANIASFLEFQEDIHYCAKCPGVGNCTKERPHFQLRLSFDGKFLERSYAPCEKILEKWEQDIQYPLCDFPVEWREKTFEKMIETRERILCQIATKKIIQNQSKNWLFITGNQRKGKAYLAVGIINSLVKAKLGPVIYLSTSDRLKELTDLSINQKDLFRKNLDKYINVPILAFEDFGNEYKSDYVRDSIVLPILLERAKNERITIFTSDFTIDEISKMYGGSSSSQIRSNQLKKLLSQMCEEPIEANGLSVY